MAEIYCRTCQKKVFEGHFCFLAWHLVMKGMQQALCDCRAPVSAYGMSCAYLLCGIKDPTFACCNVGTWNIWRKSSWKSTACAIGCGSLHPTRIEGNHTLPHLIFATLWDWLCCTWEASMVCYCYNNIVLHDIHCKHLTRRVPCIQHSPVAESRQENIRDCQAGTYPLALSLHSCYGFVRGLQHTHSLESEMFAIDCRALLAYRIIKACCCLSSFHRLLCLKICGYWLGHSWTRDRLLSAGCMSCDTSTLLTMKQKTRNRMYPVKFARHLRVELSVAVQSSHWNKACLTEYSLHTCTSWGRCNWLMQIHADIITGAQRWRWKRLQRTFSYKVIKQ